MFADIVWYSVNIENVPSQVFPQTIDACCEEEQESNWEWILNTEMGNLFAGGSGRGLVGFCVYVCLCVCIVGGFLGGVGEAGRGGDTEVRERREGVCYKSVLIFLQRTLKAVKTEIWGCCTKGQSTAMIRIHQFCSCWKHCLSAAEAHDV